MERPRQFVVEADPRGRVSLARAGNLAERYLCFALADGRIVLQPASVVSDLELGLLRAKDVADDIREGLADLDAGDIGLRGSARGANKARSRSSQGERS